MKRFWIVLVIVFVVSTGISWGVSILKTPRVAILYIATGRYIVFWDEFYQSMEKNFLPNFEKQYFVFTDNTDIIFPPNVTRIAQQDLSWPDITLNRFEMFLRIESVLEKYDYIYFLNGNAEVVGLVDKEILPTREQGIMVACHPNFYRLQDNMSYPYERDARSMAYIPFGEGKYYVQGGFNGGRSKDFLKLIHALKDNTQEDKDNKIVARWHDESHLNRYILDKNPLVMPPNYIWALFDLKLVPVFKDNIKIRMRHKDDFGGVAYLRKITNHKKGEKPTPEMQKKSFFLKNKNWTEYLVPVSADRYCRFFMDKACAKVSRKEDILTVFWEKGKPEKYRFNPAQNQYDQIETHP